MVTAVKAGELRFKVNGEWKEAAVGDGFVEIMPEFVVLLADTVEWPDEIDTGGQKKQKNGPRRGSDRRKARESTITARRRFPEQWQGLK